jgi:cytidylate kinase
LEGCKFLYLFRSQIATHELPEITDTHFVSCAASVCGWLFFWAAPQKQKAETWQAYSLSAKRLLMNLRKIVIAIDGYSACGKSTTAKVVAAILGYRYIDTGAMYRAVTLYFMDHHVAITNPKEVVRALSNINISFVVNSKNVSETFLNGLNVEKAIRRMQVSEFVSQVSTIKEVRHALVEQQRRLGKERGVVMDGRDIGTVVFPQAELKLFMTADILVRAFRRQRELLEKDQLVDLDEVVDNIVHRDKIDTTRAESPLKQADDAIVIDTTHITIDEQVDEVVRMAIAKVTSNLH